MNANKTLQEWGDSKKAETPDPKVEFLQNDDDDTWPDGWGRTGRHPTFSLQLIQRQPDGSSKTTAIIYGSIASEIVLEEGTSDTITFVYETHEGLRKVTITGKDLNNSFELNGKKFSSVHDQVCESKRLSIRENSPHIEILIEEVEEEEQPAP